MGVPNARLRELRENRNLTQTELAKQLGVVQSAISSAENGSRELSDEVKAMAAKYFDVSVDWLFFEGRYLETRCKLGRNPNPAA